MSKRRVFGFLIWIFKRIPFKRPLLLLLKKLGLSNHPIYKDLRFNGPFRLKIPQGKTLNWFHFGGQIENDLFWHGAWGKFEPEMGWAWLAMARNSQLILDVGANTGLYSLAAEAVSPDATVFSFEPAQSTFLKLQQIIELNKSRVLPFPLALSNKEGKATFYDLHEDNQTGASLAPDKYKNKPDQVQYIKEYEVEIQTGDAFLKERARVACKVDLIKLDVEMHEAEVVQGLINTIQQDRPVVFVEVLTTKVAEALNELLGPLEYAPILLVDNQKMKALQRFSAIDGKWNWLAIPQEKRGDTLLMLGVEESGPDHFIAITEKA